MRFKWLFTISVFLFLIGILVYWYRQPVKIELDNSGMCLNIGEYQRVLVEGYLHFNRDSGSSKPSADCNAGWEGIYPYCGFALSIEPNMKTKFKATFTVGRVFSNGDEIANRTVTIESENDDPTTRFKIYDYQRKEIHFNERVLITGWMRDSCTVQVETIKKL